MPIKENFVSWNEQDVREEVLAPLLKQLGYAKGTESNIIREQSLSLRYPKAFLGRKKPKSDPILRGDADYICEVKFDSNRVVRWVIEAKSPIELLDIDVVEQAFTYANHPEVGAVYFCLCNAHEFQVYQTSSGAHSPPILKVAYGDLQNSVSTLENLIGPLAIRRDWKDQAIDCGKPVGPGLRSIVQITGGFIEYHGNNQPDARLSGITVFITDGAIEREEAGHLIGFFRMRSPFAQIQRTVEKLGLNGFEAICKDSTLSTDRNIPSQFYSVQTLRFPKGENLYDFTTGREVSLPMEIVVKAETFAVGHLEGTKFSGFFKAKLSFAVIVPPMVTEGMFQVNLA